MLGRVEARKRQEFGARAIEAWAERWDYSSGRDFVWPAAGCVASGKHVERRKFYEVEEVGGDFGDCRIVVDSNRLDPRGAWVGAGLARAVESAGVES